jgi:hypothetical protein
MLTVTYGQLRDQVFGRALTKLANCSGFKSPKVTFNIAKINRRVLDEAKLADEVYQKLVRQYCRLDEKGEIEPHEGRPGTFVIPEERGDEWKAKLAEFHAISFEMDRPRIALEDVSPAQLSPAEVMALEPLLSFDETAAPHE